jgi:hypothetical protein
MRRVGDRQRYLLLEDLLSFSFLMSPKEIQLRSDPISLGAFQTNFVFELINPLGEGEEIFHNLAVQALSFLCLIAIVCNGLSAHRPHSREIRCEK